MSDPVPEAERLPCGLCGGEHEVIGTIGGVKITTCERVAEFGNVLGVIVPPLSSDEQPPPAEASDANSPQGPRHG
jgi:hypothetical protein